MIATMQADVERNRTLMIETLTDMVVDGDNEIIPDTSFYDDFGE